MRVRAKAVRWSLPIVVLALISVLLFPGGAGLLSVGTTTGSVAAPSPAASPLLVPHGTGTAGVSPAPPPATWTNLTPVLSTSPDGRVFATMTYDGVHHSALLFSGVAEHPNGHTYIADDVWNFTPATGWTNVTPGVGPGVAGRVGAMMTYDSVDGQTILYGGCDSFFCPAPYIWTYSGAGAFALDGIAQNGVGQPGALMWAGFADAPNGGGPSGGGALLFGGCNNFNTGNFACNAGGIVGAAFLVNFPGGAGAGQPTWTPIASTNSPSARELPMLAWDPAMHEDILYGGFDGSRLHNDTWAFSHGAWTNITRTVGSAPYDAGGALVYDNSSHRLLLQGGLTNGARPGTFTWALAPSGQWTNITPSVGAPTDRFAQASASFPGAQFPMVFSGSNQTNGFTPDTWIFGPQLASHLSVAPLSTDVNMAVAFAGWGSGGLAPYTSGWDLGDGNSSVGPYANHSYVNPGTYTAFYNVTDTYGLTASSSATVVVSPLPTLTAAAAPATATTASPVAFWGNTSGGTGPFTYSWDLGDGTTSTIADPGPHTYAWPGTYQANVTVTDAVGAYAHASVNVTVVAPPLVVDAGATPLSGGAPLTVAFHAHVSGGAGPIVLAWRFGDGPGGSAYGAPSHTYNATGGYNATVWANDSLGDTASKTLAIEVYTPLSVTVALSANGTLPGVPVTLTATPAGGQGGLNWLWTLNGSAYAPATGPSLVYTPGGAGSYTFSATVSDAAGDTATAGTVLTVVAQVPPLVVTVAANRTSPFPVGGTVILNATAAGGSTPYTYLWSLNGTNRSSLASGAELVFDGAHPGFYNFTCWVSDPSGQVAASGQVTVQLTALGSSSGGHPPPGGGGNPPGGSTPPSSNPLTGVLSTSSPWLYLLVVLIVAALVAAALYLRRRGRAGAATTMTAAGAGTGATAAESEGAWAEAAEEPAAEPAPETGEGGTMASGAGPSEGEAMAAEAPQVATDEPSVAGEEGEDVIVEEGEGSLAPEEAPTEEASSSPGSWDEEAPEDETSPMEGEEPPAPLVGTETAQPPSSDVAPTPEGEPAEAPAPEEGPSGPSPDEGVGPMATPDVDAPSMAEPPVASEPAEPEPEAAAAPAPKKKMRLKKKGGSDP